MNSLMRCEHPDKDTELKSASCLHIKIMYRVSFTEKDEILMMRINNISLEVAKLNDILVNKIKWIKLYKLFV